MTKKFKIIVMLMIVSLLAAFVVGCGGNAGDGNTGGGESNPSGQESPTDSEAETEDPNAVYVVKFDTCIDLPTNKALDQKAHKGDLVVEPDIRVRGENPDGYRVAGWYTDREYEAEWDFGLDKVAGDMTLYAKWDAYYDVNFYLKGLETPVYSTEVKKGRKTGRCDDSIYGYKVKGYYLSEEFAEGSEFDFDEPITSKTDIYIDVEDYMYFDSKSLANGFRAVAAISGAGSTAGSISEETKNGETYARANFGYSTARDPYICAEGLNVDITKSQIVEIKFKNVGNANQLMFYWVLKDNSGNYVGTETYSGNQNFCYTYGNKEMQMSEDDEWVILRINIASEQEPAKLNNMWKNADRLYSLRIQSLYAFNGTAGEKNELLISYIKGVYDETYDKSKAIVKFNVGGVVREIRSDKNVIIGREKAASALGGYKVLGYYKNAELTEPFDIENERIAGETEIFVKTDGTVYYDGKALYEGFKATAATKPGSTAGTTTLLSDGNLKINFGYSLIGDPSLSTNSASLSIKGITKIRVKLKNLGNASQLAIYWTAKKADGKYVGSRKDYFGSAAKWYTFKSTEKNMDEGGEWTVVEFDLSGNKYWTEAVELVKFRIQANYVSADENDLSNEMIIAEITGV